MKFIGMCIAVKDVELSRKFYEEVFDLRIVIKIMASIKHLMLAFPYNKTLIG